MHIRPTRWIGVLVLAVVLAACGGSSGAGPASGSLAFSNAWVRSAPSGGMTAAYFDVANGRGADDALTGVATDAATVAGLHETTTDGSGMMGMQEVSSVVVPAGKTVQFAPGGYHVMLMGLTGDLVVGDTVELTFTTKDSGTVTVTAAVRDN